MLQRRSDAQKNTPFLYPILTGSFHMRGNSFLQASVEKTGSLLFDSQKFSWVRQMCS